jgi:MFS family permease
MKRALRWYDVITMNVYFLGLTVLSQTFVSLVLPLLIQRFVGEGQQGRYFGVLRLAGLMLAVLVQALMGFLSDRSRLRWGRRRPFILVGTLGDLLCIAGVALSTQMEGFAGYWMLLAMYLLLQLSTNMAHAAVQSLIPDLVPESGRSHYSAVKALLEVPLAILVFRFTVARLIESGQMVAGLFALMGILVVVMAITLFTSEVPLKRSPPPVDWQPFLRLVLMTAFFTAVIVGTGTAAVRLSSWLMAEVIGSGVLSTASSLSGLATQTPVLALLAAVGGVGLVAMVSAIVFGVGGSMKISIGWEESRDHSAFGWWVISRLAFLVSTTNLASFAVFFVQGRLGYQGNEAAGPASQLMFYLGLALLVSAMTSGWLTKWLGRKRAVALSGLVAAAGTFVMLLLPNLTLIYVGGCIIGLATGVFYTASWALGTSLVPQAEAGRYLGLSNLAGAGAGAVGAYIGGPVADFFTQYVPNIPGLGYIIIFAAYGVLFLLSALILTQVREPETVAAL